MEGVVLLITLKMLVAVAAAAAAQFSLPVQARFPVVGKLTRRAEPAFASVIVVVVDQAGQSDWSPTLSVGVLWTYG